MKSKDLVTLLAAKSANLSDLAGLLEARKSIIRMELAELTTEIETQARNNSGNIDFTEKELDAGDFFLLLSKISNPELNIVSVKLGNAQINEFCAKVLAAVLANNPSLTKLDLGNSVIEAAHTDSLRKLLNSNTNTNLKYLHLTVKDFTLNSFAGWVDLVANVHTLDELSLDYTSWLGPLPNMVGCGLHEERAAAAFAKALEENLKRDFVLNVGHYVKLDSNAAAADADDADVPPCFPIRLS